MEVSERLDLLRQAAENLVKHLNDPQPGLYSWNAMLEELVEQIRFGSRSINLRETMLISRLVMDPNVSNHHPCVKGTWVTTDTVVSLIVDGSTWSEILRYYPELVEDDIRACLQWVVEHDAKKTA